MRHLVALLGNLFPCRATGADQVLRAYPYHKSVLDWLTSADAGEHRVDPTLGHELLATACRAATLMPAEAGAAGGGGCGRAYAMHHAVAHACLGGGEPGRLAELLLDYGFWGEVYRSGESWQAGGVVYLLVRSGRARGCGGADE